MATRSYHYAATKNKFNCFIGLATVLLHFFNELLLNYLLFYTV